MNYKVCGAMGVALLLSACGGGGSPAGGSTGVGSTGGGVVNYRTFDFVGAPEAPTYGSNNTPAFTTDTVVAPGTSTVNLRLLQTAASTTSNGMRSDAAVNAGGGTLGIDVNSNSLRLSVPGLGLSNVLLVDDGQGGLSANLGGGKTLALTLDLSSDAFYGGWSVTQGGQPISVGIFNTGVETKAPAVPTSGAGVFYGSANVGYAVVNNKPYVLTGGGANLNVNFATGAINGTITGLSATSVDAPTGPTLGWNDINLTGSISSSNRAVMSGSAKALAPPAANASTLTSAATGTLTGSFYGAAATSVGGVWTLSDGLNAGAGAFAASR